MSRRRRRNTPVSTILLVVVAFVAGLTMLYLFTRGIGLTEIRRIVEEVFRSRWGILTTLTPVVAGCL